MVKTSTLFYILENINEENELYNGQDLVQERVEDSEVDLLLNRLEYSPSKTILAGLYEKIKC